MNSRYDSLSADKVPAWLERKRTIGKHPVMLSLSGESIRITQVIDRPSE